MSGYEVRRFGNGEKADNREQAGSHEKASEYLGGFMANAAVSLAAIQQEGNRCHQLNLDLKAVNSQAENLMAHMKSLIAQLEDHEALLEAKHASLAQLALAYEEQARQTPTTHKVTYMAYGMAASFLLFVLFLLFG